MQTPEARIKPFVEFDLLSSPDDILLRLVQNGYVVLDTSHLRDQPHDVLDAAVTALDAAPSEALAEKTMFPERLANNAGTERRVLQWYEDRSKPVPDIPGSNSRMRIATMAACRSLCTDLLEACVTQGFVTDMNAAALTDTKEWTLNALHYPPEANGDGKLRFPAHRDWGLLSCFAAMRGRGLDIQLDGVWMPYDEEKHTMLVYAGESLTKLSNGRIRALPHCVRQVGEEPRSTLGYYADAHRALRFPDGTTVGAYIDEMLRRIGQIA